MNLSGADLELYKEVMNETFSTREATLNQVSKIPIQKIIVLEFSLLLLAQGIEFYCKNYETKLCDKGVWLDLKKELTLAVLFINFGLTLVYLGTKFLI